MFVKLYSETLRLIVACSSLSLSSKSIRKIKQISIKQTLVVFWEFYLFFPDEFEKCFNYIVSFKEIFDKICYIQFVYALYIFFWWSLTEKCSELKGVLKIKLSTAMWICSWFCFLFQWVSENSSDIKMSGHFLYLSLFNLINWNCTQLFHYHLFPILIEFIQ